MQKHTLRFVRLFANFNVAKFDDDDDDRGAVRARFPRKVAQSETFMQIHVTGRHADP